MIIKGDIECPDCGKIKTVEIYAGFEPTEFQVEKYIYFCRHCGRTIKKLLNLTERFPSDSAKYFKVEFSNNEIKTTKLPPPR